MPTLNRILNRIPRVRLEKLRGAVRLSYSLINIGKIIAGHNLTELLIFIANHAGMTGQRWEECHTVVLPQSMESRLAEADVRSASVRCNGSITPDEHDEMDMARAAMIKIRLTIVPTDSFIRILFTYRPTAGWP